MFIGSRRIRNLVCDRNNLRGRVHRDIRHIQVPFQFNIQSPREVDVHSFVHGDRCLNIDLAGFDGRENPWQPGNSPAVVFRAFPAQVGAWLEGSGHRVEVSVGR